jgi:hypothetical protein
MDLQQLTTQLEELLKVQLKPLQEIIVQEAQDSQALKQDIKTLKRETKVQSSIGKSKAAF